MKPPEGQPSASLTTGLVPLDRATGGGAPEHVWIISGLDSVGKTLLALGIARAVGLRAHVPVQWFASQEAPETLAAFVLSAEARLTVERLRAHDLSDDEQARLAAAQMKIDQAQMTFVRVPAGRLLGAARGSAPEAGSFLVLDSSFVFDLDTVADLKALAEATGAWLVAVVPDAGKGRRAARPAVKAGADNYVWIGRGDEREPASDRAGEADLWVTRANRSRATMLTVAFQDHYSRFVDISTA